jgi:hypothetical protein
VSYVLQKSDKPDTEVGSRIDKGNPCFRLMSGLRYRPDNPPAKPTLRRLRCRVLAEVSGPRGRTRHRRIGILMGKTMKDVGFVGFWKREGDQD